MTDTIISANTTGSYIGDYTSMQDCYIKQNSPTTVYNTAVLGLSNFSGTDTTNLLIRFDGLSNIAATEVASAVTQGIYCTAAGSVNATSVDWYQQLRNWVESQATWNIWSTSNNWSTAGGVGSGTDRSATTVVNKAISNTTSEWKTISDTDDAQLKTVVQGWIDGTYNNYGLIADVIAPTSSFWINFHSQSGTDGLRPYLAVTHTAGGGSPYSVTLNDTLSITDAADPYRELYRLIQSNISVLDTLNRNRELFKLFSESITTSDQLIKSLEYFRLMNEAIDMTDVLSITREHSRLLSDSFDISDLVSVVVVGNLVRLLSDTITVNDSAVVYRELFRVLIDSVSVADTLIKTLGAQVLERILSDNISVSDSAAVTRELFKSLLESITITDAVYKELERLVVISDNISINDNILLDYARLIERLLQDTLDVNDSISVVLSIFTTSVAARLLVIDIELKDIVSEILKKHIKSEIVFKDIDSDLEN